MRVILFLAALLLLPGNAAAQETNTWIPNAIAHDYEGGYWSEDNTYRRFRRFQRHYRHVQRHRHYHERTATIYYRDRDRDDVRYYAAPTHDRAVCIDRSLSRVGEERYGRDRAKESAEQQWMEEVRSRFGSRYMDTRNAKRVTYECGRSSTGNRASEKAQEVIGKFLEQCTLEAVPCRSQREREEKDR